MLSEEKINRIYDEVHNRRKMATIIFYEEFARAIEAAVLAELAEQEPVGEIRHCPGGLYEGSSIPAAPYNFAEFYNAMPPAGTPLYLHPSPAPEGMVLVPREPTEAMQEAGANTFGVYDEEGELHCMSEISAQDCWKAMIAAAEKS